ncbi:hypothetical protein QT711_00225 [Sporosarcina saromensis]|uniref:ABC-three component systems C-terminal domain-containing protein n=1 Tax=Sporosarcina saromensis TaxID=359365 RepID=A0ABU4G5C0_9BACL|nr:ABC-three component system protein [Sporosarcina saromensis]MDW0111587.1 hypothetical protein [Sporosarcina saromensis]
MDKIQRLFFEMKFDLFFYKERGNGFEDLFARIMKAKHKHDFIEVKTWGNKGDLKCDGYLQSEGIIFQVYAPNQINGSKLVAKFEEDYEKAMIHWNGIVYQWIFVQNAKDGVLGIDAVTLNEIEKYKIKEKVAIPILLWGIDEIKEIVFSLPAKEIISIFGEVPTMDDLSSLQIKHIEPFLMPFRVMSEGYISDIEIKEVPQNKIQINYLSEYIQDLLKIGMRKAHLIEKIISLGHEVDAVQNLSVAFQEKYKILKKEYKENTDQIFYELRDFAGYKYVKNPTDEIAILTILAYLFENCTIFESVPIYAE